MNTYRLFVTIPYKNSLYNIATITYTICTVLHIKSKVCERDCMGFCPNTDPGFEQT